MPSKCMLHTPLATSVRQAVPCRLHPVRAGRRGPAHLTADSTPQQLSKFLHQQKHSASSLATTLSLLDAAHKSGKFTPSHVQLLQQLVNKLPSRLESLDPKCALQSPPCDLCRCTHLTFTWHDCRQLARCAAQLAHAPSQVNSTPVVQKIARLLSNPRQLQRCPNQQLLQLGRVMAASLEPDWLLVDALVEVLTQRLLLEQVSQQEALVFTAILVRLNCCSPAWLQAAADLTAAALEQQHLHHQHQQQQQQQQQQQEQVLSSRSQGQAGPVPVPPSVVLGTLQGLAHFGIWHSRFLAAAVPALRAVVAGVELWQLPLLAWSLAVLQLLDPVHPAPGGSRQGPSEQPPNGVVQATQHQTMDEQYLGTPPGGVSGNRQVQEMCDSTTMLVRAPPSQAAAAEVGAPEAAGGGPGAFWDAHLCILERAAAGQAASSQAHPADQAGLVEAPAGVFPVTGLSQLYHAHLMQLAHLGVFGSDLAALGEDLSGTPPTLPPSVARAAGVGAAEAEQAAPEQAVPGAVALHSSPVLLEAPTPGAGGAQGVVGAVATQPAAAPAAAVEQLLTAAEGAWRELAAQKQQSTFQMEVYQVLGELGLGATLEAPAHQVVPCMTVDVAVQHVDEQGSSATASPMQQQVLELVKGAQRIAMEADGPCHFARLSTANGRVAGTASQAQGPVLQQGDPADRQSGVGCQSAGGSVHLNSSTVVPPGGPASLRLLGATKARNRLLQLLGWRVVDVPFYEWDQEGGHAYLAARLQQACSP